MNWLKWLYPGLKVKRWLFAALLGLLIIITGIGFLFHLPFLRLARVIYSWGTYRLLALGVALMLIGVGLVVFSLRQAFASVLRVLLPDQRERVIDVMFEKKILDSGPDIVVIGGGSGLSTLLRGLKVYTSNITAVVTVTDDGGSSGRLRESMGILPPGDIRNCVLALADTEPLMEQLFQHRFSQEGLKGHSFGNLLLAAMTDMTGDFQQAVTQFSKVLAVRGKVLPVTLANVTVEAELSDGRLVRGESNIGPARGMIRSLKLYPEDALALPEVQRAIGEADAIVLGPGSLYTSVIPNLLVEGVIQAIRTSPGMKIYICNVMTQPGETSGFSASDHLAAIEEVAGGPLVDCVIANTGKVREDLLRRYAEDGAEPVPVDVAALRARGYRVYSADMLLQDNAVRHDPDKLARQVMGLVVQNTIKARRKYRTGKFLAGSQFDLIDDDTCEEEN